MKMACWNYRYNQTTNDATGDHAIIRHARNLTLTLIITIGEHQMVFGQKGAYTQLSDLFMFASSNSIEALLD